jgi:hypothetical protein
MTNQTAHTVIQSIIDRAEDPCGTMQGDLMSRDIAALYHAKDIILKAELKYTQSMIEVTP